MSGSAVCSTCGVPKEASRPRSDTCRSCDREADKERKRLRALEAVESAEPILADSSLPFSPAVRKALRRGAGVSQKALADTLHVQLLTLQRWEQEPMNGRPVKPEPRTRYVDLLESWAANLEPRDLIELLRIAA